MSQEELTSSQKLAVRGEVSRILGKTAAVVGIGSIVVLIGGLSSIYSLFGERAVVEAGVRTDAYLEKRSDTIDQQIERALRNSETLQDKTSELSGKADFLTEDVNKMRLEAEQLKLDLADVHKDELVTDLVNLVKAAKGNSDIPDIVRRLERLELFDRETVEIGTVSPTEVELAQLRNKGTSLDKNNRCISGSKAHRGVLNRSVSFGKEFSEPPTVTMALRDLDAYTSKANFRLSAVVTDVSRTGFKASLYTWCDTEIWRVSATWVAVGE